MSRELKDLIVDVVALVDKGANKKKFHLLKRDEEGEKQMTDAEKKVLEEKIRKDLLEEVKEGVRKEVKDEVTKEVKEEMDKLANATEEKSKALVNAVTEVVKNLEEQMKAISVDEISKLVLSDDLKASIKKAIDFLNSMRGEVKDEDNDGDDGVTKEDIEQLTKQVEAIIASSVSKEDIEVMVKEALEIKEEK